MTPIRWAQGQGEQRRGTRWHVVVADNSNGTQRTACGTTIVQSDEWMDRAGRRYLRNNACPRCLAKYPIPDEDTTTSGAPWAGWQHSGTPSPIFGESVA